MAWGDAGTKLVAYNDAYGAVSAVRQGYVQLKQLQALMKRYTDGQDAVFIAAVNAIYTLAERQELAALLSDVNGLVTDWEANHRGALGL